MNRAPTESAKSGETSESPFQNFSASAPASQPTQPAHQRGIRLPPEFENFNAEQLDFINDLLRTKTYAEVQRIIHQETGLRISINKLFRYREKLDFAECLQISQHTDEDLQQLIHVCQGQSGQSIDLDQAGLQTIKRRALALACSPSTKPSRLLKLMRIFTWEHRKSMDDHRKQMDAQKATHRDRLARLAEQRLALQQRRFESAERRAQLRAEAQKSKPAAETTQPEPRVYPDGNMVPYLSEYAQQYIAYLRGERAEPPKRPPTAPVNPQNP